MQSCKLPIGVLKTCANTQTDPQKRLWDILAQGFRENSVLSFAEH